MPEGPATRQSLLLRLRDHQDHEAWTQFVDLYAPLIYDYARQRRLQDADAADLTQLCLRRFAASVGRLEYDPQRGSFRGWLFTLVRNMLRDFLDRPLSFQQGSGDARVHNLLESQTVSEPDEAAEWDREWRRNMFAWAAEQVRPCVQEATWQAFWKTAVENKSGHDVAAELGLSVAAVYLAKSRVMARLRAAIHEVQEEEYP
jgi:RNA polymerase sigma factor (sigma-70 family)